MEFDELLITTGVDALVRLVKEKRRIELEIAAELLNIPASTIEDWARVLDEEGILKIEYHLTKQYLVWTEPAESEITKEREAFYSQKQDLQQEIESLRSRIKPEVENVDDLKRAFLDIYKKLYPRLQKFEKSLAEVSTKGGTKDSYSDYLAKIDERKKELSEAISEIESVKKDLKQMGDSLKIKPDDKLDLSKFNNLLAELGELKKELAAIRAEAKAGSKSVPEHMPSLADIREKLLLLRTEFMDVKKRNSNLRQKTESIKEAYDIVESIRASISDHEKQLSRAKKDIDGMKTAVEKASDKVEEASRRLKEEMDVIERFSDSMEVAREVVSKFPPQSEIKKESEDMDKREREVQSKLDDLQKLLAAIGKPMKSVKDFSDLEDRITRKETEVDEKSGQLEKSLDHQKALYQTYQNVRDKTIKTVEKYLGRVTSLSEELQALRSESSRLEDEAAVKRKAVLSAVEDKNLRELIGQAEELNEKKKLLEEISEKMESINGSAQNLNKKLNLLSKTAKILELRGASGNLAEDRSAGTGEQQERPEKEAYNQITLTRSEEEDFRRKREELRNLIKKLWEQP